MFSHSPDFLDNNNGKAETRHSQGGMAQDQKQAPHEAKASAALEVTQQA
jgi:hypothetical protein